MKPIGVNLEDWVVEEVDRPLEYGDSRSQRINDALRVAIAAEKAALRLNVWPDDVEEREELMVEVLEFYHEHHPDDT